MFTKEIKEKIHSRCKYSDMNDNNFISHVYNSGRLKQKYYYFHDSLVQQFIDRYQQIKFYTHTLVRQQTNRHEYYKKSKTQSYWKLYLRVCKDKFMRYQYANRKKKSNLYITLKCSFLHLPQSGVNITIKMDTQYNSLL